MEPSNAAPARIDKPPVRPRLLAQYPLDAGAEAVIDNLRDRLAARGVTLHEGRLAPSGPQQFRVRRLADGFEFGLLPCGELPAEMMEVRFDEDNVAAVHGPVPLWQRQLATVLFGVAVFSIPALALSLVVGNVSPLMMLVPMVVVMALWFIAQRFGAPNQRQKAVMQELRGALHPLVRAALPGVPYR